MKSRENKNSKGGVGKIVTSLVVGSVIGATVGLLMAPTSGEKTLKRIKGEAKGAQKKARAAVANIEDKGHELVDDVKGNVETVRENIVDRLTRRKK